ncbi:MAG: UDP-N-acetylmuramoyl-L-alanyl-D-glutamate--2,6-diaminopimelate ligase [Candidatus Hydrogenedens sp.]|nr:UDP-N-acetylmuramoyl-L-alanyl-D-glutamate--2,6-diaminopimelate ligase [Candidatus Hydrogenedens sp.]
MPQSNLEQRLREAGELSGPLSPAASDALARATRATEDSRRVIPGAVFCAVSGGRTDGHAFIPRAVEAGAIAVLGDRAGETETGGVPYIAVPHPRRCAGLLAHALEGDPTAAITVAGITGTNGKSSTAALTASILEAAGHNTAVFGTLGYVINGEVLGQEHTTPFGEELASLFARARDAGVSHVVMEVSSHSLDQERVAGIRFAAGAFTNLTQDHLDYHGTMEAYRDAKLKLFQRLDAVTGAAAINADDPYGQSFVDASGCRVITFGEHGVVSAQRIKTDLHGCSFQLRGPWGALPVHLKLLGRHNVSNALCAAALAHGMGVAAEHIVAGLAGLAAVPGRFEPVAVGTPFQVVVDYAHTDDGLINVLKAARELSKGQIITVFGCGGDRDKTKRPKMGKAAGKLSDYCVLTSDNPRTEDPLRILLDAEVGLQQAGRVKNEHYTVIVDRAEAIRAAIERAKPGDIVMIAGKGHEDYQILGTEKIHFDDREVARAILAERSA